jgi:hypothetical protein
MKQLSIVCILLLFVPLYVCAQVTTAQGQIITAEDTIDVVFAIPVKLPDSLPDYEKLQRRFIYNDAAGKQVRVTPRHAKEIRFAYNSETIRMISTNKLVLDSASMSGYTFLKLDIDGTLKLYTYYYTSRSVEMDVGAIKIPPYSSNGQKKIFSKREGEFIIPRFFIIDMKHYLSDCPELVSKIQNKDFERGDEDSIVNFYNDTCGK